MLVQHLLGHPLDVGHVGQVAAVHEGDAAEVLDLLLGLLELLGGPGDQDDPATGGADAQRGGPADARGRPGDHHRPALDRPGERAVLAAVRAVVALPVLPERLRVGGQRRHGDARAGSACCVFVESKWVG